MSFANLVKIEEEAMSPNIKTKFKPKRVTFSFELMINVITCSQTKSESARAELTHLREGGL